ncbi:MAG: sensor histidine kinase, partial [Planctomycetota bacterium]
MAAAASDRVSDDAINAALATSSPAISRSISDADQHEPLRQQEREQEQEQEQEQQQQLDWGWLWSAAFLVLIGICTLLAISRHRLGRHLKAFERQVDQAVRQWQLDMRMELPRQNTAASIGASINRIFERFHDRWHQSENQRQILEAVMFSMTEGVIAIDQNERLVRINQAAAAALRVTPAWALGRSIQEVVRNASLQDLIMSVLVTGVPAEDDIVLYVEHETRPGITLPRFLQVHANRLDDLSGNQIGAMLVFTDVTRLRHLEAMRSDFVANVSHEVRTPLTAIRGAVETITDAQLDEGLPPDLARFLKIIERQSGRLQSIMEDLLNLARIEQPRGDGQHLDREVAPIRPILCAAIEMSEHHALSKRIEFTIDCDPGLTGWVHQVLLEQALTNLID